MGSFSADHAVEALDFNFEPHVPGARGTIPEPTHAQVLAYFAKLGVLRSERIQRLAAITADADLTDDERRERIDLAADENDAGVLRAVSVVCSDIPSLEQITALPHRFQVAFCEWLRGELQNPTRPAAASTASRAGLNGAGSTT